MSATATASLNLLPASIRSTIPPLYAQDGSGMQATVYLHLFGPAGDWWITELDHDGITAFGYTRLASMPDCAELGYIHIPELQAIVDRFKADPLHNLHCLIERDLHWQPCSLTEAIAR